MGGWRYLPESGDAAAGPPGVRDDGVGSGGEGALTVLLEPFWPRHKAGETRRNVTKKSRIFNKRVDVGEFQELPMLALE